MKLGLGTVQFGMDYGISSAPGRVAEAEVERILQKARAAGVDTLDTAIGYGVSEAVLGNLGAGDAQAGWQIITKLPSLPAELPADQVSDWCAAQLAGALERLNTPRVSSLLLHRVDDLLGPHGLALAKALSALKTQGLCGAIGVSLYGPQDLDALEKGPVPFDMLPLDLVQVPCNPLDQRLEQSGWATRLVEQKTRIHLRSAFLQGLLLFPAGTWPAHFHPYAAPLEQWQSWLRDTGQTPLSAALRFTVSRPYAERVIIGVDSVEQLDSNLTALLQNGPIAPPDLASTETALLDPREWISS